MGFRAKRQGNIDANHNRVKKIAQRFYSVFDTSGAADTVDLIISGGHGKTIAVEIKTESKHALYTLGQLDVIARWRGFVALVTTDNEMLAVMNDPEKHCLTRKQKDAILGLIEMKKRKTKTKQWRKAKVSSSVVKKVLGT